MNIEKTGLIALSVYTSYHILKFFISEDIRITFTRDALSLAGATYIGFTVYDSLNKS
jgi:hypothetical protein